MLRLPQHSRSHGRQTQLRGDDSGSYVRVRHGPGARHIESVKAGIGTTPEIVNPAQMEPDAINDFCGCCHRTSFQVEKVGARGLQTVRFQPYRLARSRCWSPRDRRIQCTACHDPHQPLVSEVAAYDCKCPACHSQARASTHSTAGGKVCPVKTRDCIGCHMPKIQLGGNGLTFTDHLIRYHAIWFQRIFTTYLQTHTSRLV
jgi:hypothetical protein